MSFARFDHSYCLTAELWGQRFEDFWSPRRHLFTNCTVPALPLSPLPLPPTPTARPWPGRARWSATVPAAAGTCAARAEWRCLRPAGRGELAVRCFTSAALLFRAGVRAPTAGPRLLLRRSEHFISNPSVRSSHKSRPLREGSSRSPAGWPGF